MPEEFPKNIDETSIDAILENLSRVPQRSNRMILIGAPVWVRRMIHLMHVARITEVRDWSPCIPTGDRTEVISVMQRPQTEA
jgi:hypothetical protein